MARIRPLARTDAVVTEDVADEVLVYDERTDVACRLNQSAALVWRNSDGKRTLEDLVHVLEADLGDVADEDMVLMALDSLAEHGLIESGYEARDSTASRLSRRRAPERRRGIECEQEREQDGRKLLAEDAGWFPVPYTSGGR